ncbi:hypothetical protein CLAFUW4_20042 [Fulvia fulva]|uniref:uncharacterized protein n=1 Tax=Passalora fulva TaxID=5499 RepID=UPI002852B842|nr:uncharacterized protein CLAFUR5_20042 [Fulvia fulva]KAK4624649.1 hypothetical protein CLAFUR4_20042 [Fulvia fulva]KAK4625311.1 hypothetical protein CLAFUR0_20042 [Fulvia fulva]WMI38888.1 hypothetical protein CLAFUR5_20042 [Fulvia fulva]WPV14535.1 hypothetical protein CLAFUW4_20042 [Fulvia fulva]WPV30567.1 hypothetical protein CLAFUW7_20042 [Fulvia fulva]
MQFSIFYQILAALALVQVAVAAGCTSSSQCGHPFKCLVCPGGGTCTSGSECRNTAGCSCPP